ncbi:hypothetical protein BC628DRAFT_1422026 [Trametes gibbosa]|nr:hypothetical protein BC628DRAFT_1422026 [Trametes gibbosa]
MATRMASTCSNEPTHQVLIRSLGPSRDSVSTPDYDNLLTMGSYPPECIPRLGSFIQALTALRIQHKPIAVRYTPQTMAPLLHVSHAECTLESLLQQSLLQRLFHVRELTSYDIEIPVLSAKLVRKMRARYVKEELTLRGELPSIVQFATALDAEALCKLVVRFRRSQSDTYGIDFAYSLQLPEQGYANMRTLKLVETEEYARFSGIPLAHLLRPFQGLRQLEDVEVQLEKSAMHARDEDIAQLAKAWSRLRRLVLSCTRCTAAVPTLDSLYTLADRCRSLSKLVLPQLDLQNLGKTIERRPPEEPLLAPSYCGTPGEQPHALHLFGVACDSMIRISDRQAMRIARCIDSLFPYIDLNASWKVDDSVEALLGDWYLIWVNIAVTKGLRNCAPGRAYLD